MRLLKLFRKKPFCNDTHFFLIAVMLLMVSLKYWYFFFVLGAYFIFLFVKTNRAVPVAVFLCLLGLILSIRGYLFTKEYSGEQTVYVLSAQDSDTYTILKNGVQIRVSEEAHENEPGDWIVVVLTKKEIKEKGYAEAFDYVEYLHGKGISYTAKGKTLEKKKHFFSPYGLKYKYLSYLETILSEESYGYVSAMVFGENTLEASVKDSYSILGISHILAISGLHILFLYRILCFIFLKLFHYYRKTIPVVMVCCFTLLIGAPASALRASLFLLLGALNQRGEARYTKLDILSISCILMLLVNPYQIYLSGFMLSYLVSFVLIFAGEIIEARGKLVGMYKSYFLIFFSTFPIVIGITNRVSLLSLVLSPLLSLVIPFVILPLSYILAIVPITDTVFRYVFLFINQYLSGLSAYSIFVYVPSFSFLLSVLYYALFIGIIVSLVKKKSIVYPLVLLCCFLVIFISKRSINPFYRVTFIDCGQGDSILLEAPNNQGTILIDAFYSYDYLKSQGIHHIDAVIFTHSDSDHIGDYEKILANMSVGAVYYPLYDDAFINLMKDISKIPLSSGDSISFGEFTLEVYGPVNKASEVNSNSLVLKTRIDQTSYLFTGDMTIEEEKDLIAKYGDKLDVDILKVGHHGSSTSSSEEFLRLVSPSISIISVAKKNSYGLPDDKVVERISRRSSLYQTKDCGNISIYHGFGKVHISTYRDNVIE